MKWLIPVGDGRYRLRRGGEFAAAMMLLAGLFLIMGGTSVAVLMEWMGKARPGFMTEVWAWKCGIGAGLIAFMFCTIRQTFVDIPFKSIEIRSLWFGHIVALYPFQEIGLLKVALVGRRRCQTSQIFFCDRISSQPVVLVRFGSWNRAVEVVQEIAALTGIPCEIPPKPK